MRKTLKAAAPSVFCLLCGNDFQPVAVRIGDKIDAHCRIFKADAVHFLVLCVCGIEIIHAEGKVEQDFYGNRIVPLRAVNNKVIVPSAEEIAANPRSRSAKLRVAEKL